MDNRGRLQAHFGKNTRTQRIKKQGILVFWGSLLGWATLVLWLSSQKNGLAFSSSVLSQRSVLQKGSSDFAEEEKEKKEEKEPPLPHETSKDFFQG